MLADIAALGELALGEIAPFSIPPVPPDLSKPIAIAVAGGSVTATQTAGGRVLNVTPAGGQPVKVTN